MLIEPGSKEELTALGVGRVLEEAARVGWEEGPLPSWGLGAGAV